MNNIVYANCDDLMTVGKRAVQLFFAIINIKMQIL